MTIMLHPWLCYTHDYVTLMAMLHSWLCYTHGYGDFSSVQDFPIWLLLTREVVVIHLQQSMERTVGESFSAHITACQTINESLFCFVLFCFVLFCFVLFLFSNSRVGLLYVYRLVGEPIMVC